MKTWCSGYCGRMKNMIDLTLTEDGYLCSDCLEAAETSYP